MKKLHLGGSILLVGLALAFLQVQARADDDPPPIFLEEIPPIGDFTAVFASEGLTYTATQGYLQVMDLSDPSNPLILGYFVLPGVPEDLWVEDLVVWDGIAYLALGDVGLRAVDASNPYDMDQVWEYGPEEGFSGYAVQLDADAGRLYAAATAGGLFIFDLSAQQAPVLAAHWTETNSVVDVLGWDDRVITGCRDHWPGDHGALQILDLTDPAQPALLADMGFYESLSGEGMYALERHENLIYAVNGANDLTPYGNWATLWIIDAANPASPQVLSVTVLGGYYGDEYEIALDFPRLFITTTSWEYASPFYWTDFHIVDASHPEEPVHFPLSFETNATFDLFATTEALYAAGRSFRTAPFPVLSDLDLQELGVPAPQDMVFDERRYTGIFTGYAGHTALPSETPENVQYQIIVPPEYELFERFLFQFTWYEGFWGNLTGGVTAYDVWNTPAITSLHSIFEFSDDLQQPEAVAMTGDRVYVRYEPGNATLAAYDFSDPVNPIQISAIPIEVGHTRMAAAGDLLFAGLTYGFEVFDYTDPVNPVSLAIESVYGPVNDLVLIDNMLYLAAGGDGLVIFDVSNPADPIRLGELATPGTAAELVVKGSFAFLADGPGGLRVIDVSNPLNPFEIAAYDRVFDTSQVAVDRSRIWLLDPDGMAFVFRMGHSAYGTVIDIHGWPVPDVAILSNQGAAGETNWAGTFSLDFLVPGDLTVTPLRAGAGFLPISRTVTVPPDADLQTFVMLGAPAAVQVAPQIAATLRFTDTQGLPTTVYFPPDSVAVTATARLTPTLAVPWGYTFAYHAFDLDFPPVQGCPAPVEVAISFSALDVAAVTDLQDLDLWWWDGAAWLPAGGQVNGSVIEADLCLPGRWALFGPSHLLWLPFVRQ